MLQFFGRLTFNVTPDTGVKDLLLQFLATNDGIDRRTSFEGEIIVDQPSLGLLPARGPLVW